MLNVSRLREKQITSLQMEYYDVHHHQTHHTVSSLSLMTGNDVYIDNWCPATAGKYKFHDNLGYFALKNHLRTIRLTPFIQMYQMYLQMFSMVRVRMPYVRYGCIHAQWKMMSECEKTACSNSRYNCVFRISFEFYSKCCRLFAFPFCWVEM